MTKKREFVVDPEDGMKVELVKGWYAEKHAILREYCKITAPARLKWSFGGQFGTGSTYIDLFCGFGKCGDRDKSSNTISEAGPLVALKAARDAGAPFDRVFLNDLDPQALETCVSRVRSAGFKVEEFSLPADQAVDHVIQRLPRNALNFAYLDPFNIGSLPFSIIKKLGSQKKADMLIHVSVSDLNRNFSRNLNRELSDLDGFAPGWREEVVATGGLTQRRFKVAEYWTRLLQAEGYLKPDNMHDIKADRGQLLYRLALITKHSLGKKLWYGCIKANTRQMGLF